MTVANLTASIDFSLRVKQSKQKLLDVYGSTALVAYSLYPQGGAYAGPLFNVRRDGDNLGQDFYQTDGDFPYEEFKKWLGYDTNLVPASDFAGATSGTPGANAHGWGVISSGGLTRTQTLGMTNGMISLAEQYAGTTIGTEAYMLLTPSGVGPTVVAAAPGQAWTFSIYIQNTVADPNITNLILELLAFTATGGEAGRVALTVTSKTTLSLATLVYPSLPANTTYVSPRIRMSFANGAVITNQTFTMAMPQLRLGNVAFSSRGFLTQMYDHTGSGQTLSQPTAAMQFAIGFGPDGTAEVQGNSGATNLMSEAVGVVSYPADISFVAFARSYNATWDHLYNFMGTSGGGPDILSKQPAPYGSAVRCEW
jgi:hypothetical protein